MGDATDSAWERSDAAAHARALVQAAQARRGGADGDQEVAERCHALQSLSQLLLAPGGGSAVAVCWRELWGGLHNLCNDKLLAIAQAAALACGILAASVSHTLPSPQSRPPTNSNASSPSQHPNAQAPFDLQSIPPLATGWSTSPALQAPPTGWGEPPQPRPPSKPQNLRARSSPRGLLRRGAREAAPPDPERTQERRWLAGFFQWVRTLLSDGLQRTPPGGGRSAAALVALHEVFARGSVGVLQGEARKMLVAVQALLEDEETPLGLLSPLVHLVAALGKNFPGAFTGHQFVDIVDVLLGWALDPTLPEALHHQMTQGAFLHFHPALWAENYQFAVNLLSKLSADLGRLTNVSEKQEKISEPVTVSGKSVEAPQSVEEDGKAELVESGPTLKSEKDGGVVREEHEVSSLEEGLGGVENSAGQEKELDLEGNSSSRVGALDSQMENEQERAVGLGEAGVGPQPDSIVNYEGERTAGHNGQQEESGKVRGVEESGGSLTAAAEQTARDKESRLAASPEVAATVLESTKEGTPSVGGQGADALTTKSAKLTPPGTLEESPEVSDIQKHETPDIEPQTLPESVEQDENGANLRGLQPPNPAKPSLTFDPQCLLTSEQAGHLLCLLRCFESVLEALASSLFASGRAKTLKPFAKQWLPQILTCATRVGGQLQDATWTRECCRSLAVLAEILGEGFASFYPEAVKYLLEVLEHASSQLDASQISAILQVNLQLLASQRQSLLPSSVTSLVSSPVLLNLRMHVHQNVVQSVVRTFLYLLQHDSTSIVHVAISVLTRETSLALKSLAGVWGGRFAGAVSPLEERSIESSLAVFKLDVSLLVACAVKKSFPGGSPEANKGGGAEAERVFERKGAGFGGFEPPEKSLTEGPVSGAASLESGAGAANMDETGPSLAKSTPTQRTVHVLATLFRKAEPVPQLREALFDAIRTICQAYFQASPSKQSLLSARLCTLALAPSSSFALKLKALDWAQQLLTPVPSPAFGSSTPSQNGVKPASSVSQSVGQTLFMGLMMTLLDPEEAVREKSANILLESLRGGVLTSQQIGQLAEGAVTLKGDINKGVRGLGSVLLREVGLALWLSSNGVSKGTPDPYQIAIAKQSRSFRPQQLALLLQHLGQTQHQTEPPLADDWLQRLLHSLGPPPRTDQETTPPYETTPSYAGHLHDVESQRVGHPIGGSDWVERASISHVAAQHWLVQEAARHCVSSKLRTHFGGPTQTFAAIEQLLKTAVTQLLAGREEGAERGRWRLAPIHFLLEFVDALERQIWGTTHGSGILPPYAEEVGVFFAGNRKVVDEWFARLRGLLVQATSLLQEHRAASWQGSLRLEGLRNATRALASQPDQKGGEIWTRLQKDVNSALHQLALALTEAEDPDSIQGLRIWMKNAFPSQFWVNGSGKTTKGDGVVSDFGWLQVLLLQASGYHEAALEACGRLLNLELLEGLAPETARLLVERACAGYLAVADWQGLQEWVSKVQNLRATNAGATWATGLSFASLDLNPILALGKFDEGDYSAASTYLDQTLVENRRVTLNPRLALQKGEQMLLQAVIGGSKAGEDLRAAGELLDDPESAAVTVGSLAGRGQFLVQAECLRMVETALKRAEGREETAGLLPKKCGKILQEGLHFDTFKPESLKLLRAAQFAVNVGKSRAAKSKSGEPFHSNRSVPSIETLYLHVIRSARQHKNSSLASRLLEKGPFYPSKTAPPPHLVPALDFERALVLHDLGKAVDAAALFTKLTEGENTLIAGLPARKGGSQETIHIARAFLKLAKWAQAPRTYAAVSNTRKGGIGDGGNEERFLSKAVTVAPQFGKAWYQQAVWCDGQSNNEAGGATKLTETEHEVLRGLVARLVASQEGILTGLERGENLIGSLLENLVATMEVPGAPTDRPKSAELGIKSAGHPSSAEQRPRSADRPKSGEKSPEKSFSVSLDGQSSWEFEARLRHKVERLFLAEGIPCTEEQLAEVISIWRGARTRGLRKTAVAIRGYSRFLFLSLGPRPPSPSSPADATEPADVSTDADDVSASCPREDRALHALVRLLQLVSEHGAVLGGEVSDALPGVPVYIWQAVLPQLFALVKSHPQREVRDQILGVLRGVARDLPWAVLYQVLAGCREEDASAEFVALRATLVEVAPNAVSDTESFLGDSGLQRLILLWSEAWLQLLTDLSHDVSKRLNTLHKEMQRVSANTNLPSADRARINRSKYVALMTPVAVLIERKLAMTSAKADGAYDVQFRERYAPRLRAALVGLKEAPALLKEDDDVMAGDIPALKSACWDPFTSIIKELTSELQKHTLLLADLSPRLANLVNSHVPLPGFESQTPSLIPQSLPPAISFSDSLAASETLDLLNPDPEGALTIAGLTAEVAMLNTKTRPKRIGMIGSDGRRYHFLLKGREDLRLDARIMQILRACNSILRSRRSSRVRILAIRQYSVTPISARAGLIQWVPGLQSVYSSYKAWQHRQYALQVQGGMANGVEVPPHPPRPSDLYYAKIMAGLKEKGLRHVTSRKEWPQDVKRKALIDLMKDTPRQLLAKEIWLGSSGAASAFERQQRYSRTAAVMSMVGHVVGLGDRHLDNILIDFSTADVVHIDHNVAFDKGLKLRVPEVVPFRLTPIMQQALGLTGVEGTFRIACEETLTALRANQSSLLGLLDVFTWEPLAEWTSAEGQAEGAALEREERLGMEVAVSLSLLASRLQEQQQPMQDHCNFLLNTVPLLYNELVPFYSAQITFHETVSASTALQERAQSLAGQGVLLELQLGGAKTATQTAESNLAVSLQQMEALRVGVEAAAKESRQWWEQHENAVQGLLGSGPAKEQVASILAAVGEITLPPPITFIGALECTGLGASMLPQSLYLSCQTLDNRVLQLSQARAETHVEGVNALQAYKRALLELLPPTYAKASVVWQCVQSMERAMSGAGVADLSGLVEGLRGLLKDRTEGVVREYPLVKARLGAVEGKLKKLVRQVPEDEPFVTRETDAFGQMRAWLGLEPSPDSPKNQEDLFLGRFGSFAPAGHQIAPEKMRALRSAVKQAAQTMKKGLEELHSKTDVRLVVTLSEVFLDKCRAMQKVLELAAPESGSPGGTLSAQLGTCSDSLGSILVGADAFEQELLPELSAALLKRDAGVREALLAVRRLWDDVSRVMLAAEEEMELAGKILETEKKVLDIEVRLEGLSLVAQASKRAGVVSAGGFGGGPSQESAQGLSGASVHSLESHGGGLSPGEESNISQDGGFEHSQRVAADRAFSQSQGSSIGQLDPNSDESLHAVQEAINARGALQKELETLREELRSMREEPHEAQDLLASVRGVKERFAALLIQSESPGGVASVIERAAKELGGIVGGLAKGSENVEGGDGMWSVPESLKKEAAFISQLGLFSAVAESCMLTAGPNVLSVQVETAGLQSLWEGLGGLASGRILPVLKAACERFAEGLESEDTREVNQEVASLLDRYVNVAGELGPVQRRRKEGERKITEQRREAWECAVKVAQLEWEHGSVLRQMVENLVWESQTPPFQENPGGLKWWQREAVVTTLSRVVNSLTALQEATNAMAQEGRLAERELDSLVAFVGGDFTTVLRSKLTERRQALWQEEQNGLALNQLSKLVLEMEAARGVDPPGALGGLGLAQTGRVWVEGCARLLTQFHQALTQHLHIAEALQTTRVHQAALLDQYNAQFQAVAQLQEQEQGLRGVLLVVGEELRQRAPRVTSAVAGFLEEGEKHSALTSGSEGVLTEILAATEGGVDDIADVRARAEDVLAVQKNLIDQTRQLQDALNPLPTLLNPLLQTLPTLPAPGFEVNVIQPETSVTLVPWVRLFLGELLPVTTKAQEALRQLGAEVPKNAEEALEGVLEVAETAGAHAAAALQRAAVGAGEDAHGDALAQNAAPVDTHIAEELGKVSDAPPSDAKTTSEEKAASTESPSQSAPRGTSTQEKTTAPNATQQKGESQAGGKQSRGKEKVKTGGRDGKRGAAKEDGFQKSRHALLVVETVRGKLEGRINAVIPSAPTSSRVLTVAEQVESLLRQATSIDNLASMYEGWTAWI